MSPWIDERDLPDESSPYLRIVLRDTDRGLGCGAGAVAQPCPKSRGKSGHRARSMDDIYKTAIVLIKKHYVEDDSALAAGEAFEVLFHSMKEKGLARGTP